MGNLKTTFSGSIRALTCLSAIPDKQHAGKRLDAFVQHQDVPPTVLDLFGVPHEGLDGLSMWPLVTGEREKNRDFVIAGWGQHATVRDHEHNYVVDFEQGPRKTDSGGFTVTQETAALHVQEELYNLSNDPLETTNVLDSEPDAALKQRGRLGRLLGTSSCLRISTTACGHTNIRGAYMPRRARS